MSYCSTADLANVTGSPLSSTILQALIDDGDREIDAYLAPFGVSASVTGACKSASLKLAQAGLLHYNLQTGTMQATSGDFTSSVDVTRAAESLRKSAFTLLNQYVDNQTTLSSPKRVFGRKVCGR